MLDLAVEVADALADAPALHLDLLLAEASARPHSPTPPANLTVVRVGADQSRQQVMQARRLDLQTAFVCAGVLGEDLEDDLGAVEHPRLDRQLQVALLSRAQVLVADDEVELALELQIAQGLHLAHADEMRRVDL